MPPSAPDPRRIAAALEERVLGQREAAREIAIALAKKLAGLETGNVLMIGSSGTGKTTLMRAVESFLEAEPAVAGGTTLIRIHANVLAAEGERGRPGEAVLHRLLRRASEGSEGIGRDELLERVRHGLVFVDEIDKIRTRIGDRPHLAGIRAQESLLTLIENESVPLALPESLGGGTVAFDASGLLFVAAGAFEGLYDAVYDRVTLGRDRGALRSVTVMGDDGPREELRFRLRDWLDTGDLFEYGMSPQFLSRFDSVVLLDDLDQETLVKILLEGPDSAYRRALAYFEAHGLRLALSPAAVHRIAAEAARQPRLGARALNSVFRRVIRSYELDPAAAADGGAVVIDRPEVEAALAAPEPGAAAGD